MVVMQEVVQPAAARDKRERQMVSGGREQDRPDGRPHHVGQPERLEDDAEPAPELTLEERQLEEVPELYPEPRRRLMPGDLCPYHRRHDVVRTQEPGQVRVHAEQDRDPIQVQQEGEQDAEQRVEAEKRRKAEQHAERERGRGSLRRIVDMQQPLEPPADEVPREMNHRK